MEIRKKITYEDAGTFLYLARTRAALQHQRLGQLLINELDPSNTNPEIFYSEDERKVEAWFYTTWVA
jgi:hypothetical protein